MPKYGVEISEVVGLELDVAPGAPVLRRATFSFEVAEGDVDDTLERFGGKRRFALTGEGVWTRHRVPLTRDGEEVGMATLRVWAVPGDPLPPPAVFACVRGSGR